MAYFTICQQNPCKTLQSWRKIKRCKVFSNIKEIFFSFIQHWKREKFIEDKLLKAENIFFSIKLGKLQSLIGEKLSFSFFSNSVFHGQNFVGLIDNRIKSFRAESRSTKNSPVLNQL